MAKKSDRTVLKVRDIMTKNLVTVNRREILKNVVKKMFKENVRCIPVVDGKKFVGLISHGDIVQKIVIEGLSDFNQVIGAMKTDTVSVDPDMDMHELELLMARKNLRRVAVVDKDKALIGLITQTDIIRYRHAPSME